MNRKNNNEKSIIDYIITCQHLASKTIESTTEDGTTNIIRGNNPTDHNIITAILDIETQKETKTTKQWKKGQPKDWEKFNHTLTKEWEKINEINQDAKRLQKIITNTLENTIGSRTIKTNRKVKITNPEIKEAKASRKKHKHNFNAACRNNDQ